MPERSASQFQSPAIRGVWLALENDIRAQETGPIELSMRDLRSRSLR